MICDVCVYVMNNESYDGQKRDFSSYSRNRGGIPRKSGMMGALIIPLEIMSQQNVLFILYVFILYKR